MVEVQGIQCFNFGMMVRRRLLPNCLISTTPLMTRDFKQMICRLMVGIMLFAQISIAAYACPAVSANAAAQASAMEGMVNCEQMSGHADKTFANLCAEHCHQGQQSNHTQVPTLPAVLLVILYPVGQTSSGSGPSRLALTTDPGIDEPPAPLSILHCCFRI